MPHSRHFGEGAAYPCCTQVTGSEVEAEQVVGRPKAEGEADRC